jgi:copper chaperone
MQTKTVTIPGINCGHCEATIREEVGALGGVTEVKASSQTKQMTVSWDAPANWEQIESLLVEINYPPAGDNVIALSAV